MTYTELVTFVADICENTFPTVDMDMFIKQAEQKIYNTVQIANLRKNVTGLTTANNKYLSAPNDFLSVYSIAIYPLTGPNANEYTYLLTKDVNFIREAYPKATDTGQPAHYAIFGPNSALPNELTFILGPTPDAQYGTELHYYYYPESIVTAQTTWLGDNFDSALLNGTLIEAIRYMKGEPDMVALYQGMYDRAMIQLKQLGDGKQRQDAYRDGQARVQVV
jgi:hypothetical protein